MLIKLNYKPVSVNDVWKGRRFKTKEYKQYENDLSILLWQFKEPRLSKSIKITYRFYQKSVLVSDADNLIKPLQDILVKTGFLSDDRYIMEMHIYKIKADTDYMEIEIENTLNPHRNTGAIN